MIGKPAYIPQWSCVCVVTGFDGDAMCYLVILPNGDEAYIPIYFLEQLQ